MKVIQATRSQSRFAPILELARLATLAPLGVVMEGNKESVARPLVSATKGIADDGRACLQIQTRDPAQEARLLLDYKNPDLVDASLDYLKHRLGAIGLHLVQPTDLRPLNS